jgi:hypothetical protein
MGKLRILTSLTKCLVGFEQLEKLRPEHKFTILQGQIDKFYVTDKFTLRN